MTAIKVPTAYKDLVVVASYSVQIPEPGDFHAEVSNNDTLPAHPPLAMKGRQNVPGNFNHTQLLASSNPGGRWVIVHPKTYDLLQGLFPSPRNPLRLSDVFALQERRGGLEAIATAFTWGDFRDELIPAGEHDDSTPSRTGATFPVFYAAPNLVTIAYRGLKDEVNRHKRGVQLPHYDIAEDVEDEFGNTLAARRSSLTLPATAKEVSSREVGENHRVQTFDMRE
jgi:hypothetical protein